MPSARLVMRSPTAGGPSKNTVSVPQSAGARLAPAAGAASLPAGAVGEGVGVWEARMEAAAACCMPPSTPQPGQVRRRAPGAVCSGVFVPNPPAVVFFSCALHGRPREPLSTGAAWAARSARRLCSAGSRPGRRAEARRTP